jgi:threonine/homoserine/homoserine lactone efflux protein
MPFAFLLKGILVGIVIAVPVGPVGVLCVRRTIFQGRLLGLLSGIGAATADLLFGVVAGFGLTVVQQWLLDYQDWLRAGGGLFLLWIGAAALRKRELSAAETSRSGEDFVQAFLSTFLLTITNPITILAFLGVFAAVGFSGGEATLPNGLMLIAGVGAGSLLWWLGIAFGAGLFRGRLDEKHLLWINRGSGAILILSGLGLLVGFVVDRLGA